MTEGLIAFPVLLYTLCYYICFCFYIVSPEIPIHFAWIMACRMNPFSEFCGRWRAWNFSFLCLQLHHTDIKCLKRQNILFLQRINLGIADLVGPGPDDASQTKLFLYAVTRFDLLEETVPNGP